MKNILFLFALSVSFLGCTPKWGLYQKCEIVDNMEIYSTYTLDKNDKAKKFLRKKGMPDSLLTVIVNQANENRWPPGLRTKELRRSNLAKMRRYDAYVAAEFKRKYILYIPLAENKNVAPEVLADKDLYMIISKKGVHLKDKVIDMGEPVNYRKLKRETKKNNAAAKSTVTPQPQTAPTPGMQPPVRPSNVPLHAPNVPKPGTISPVQRPTDVKPK